MAAILSAAMDGIDSDMQPPDAVQGNAYADSAAILPNTWESALAAFANSSLVEQRLGGDFQRIYHEVKRQEKNRIESTVSDVEYQAYLRTV